jgi:hypothetical protein
VTQSFAIPRNQCELATAASRQPPIRGSVRNRRSYPRGTDVPVRALTVSQDLTEPDPCSPTGPNSQSTDPTANRFTTVACKDESIAQPSRKEFTVTQVAGCHSKTLDAPATRSQEQLATRPRNGTSLGLRPSPPYPPNDRSTQDARKASQVARPLGPLGGSTLPCGRMGPSSAGSLLRKRGP